MKNFKTIIAFLFFFSASFACAAEVIFDAGKNRFDKGEEFLVSVYINTDNTPLNAFAGKLLFSPDILEEKEIRDGDSLVNFWVERPQVTKAKDAIVFSGITPGGYTGQKGLLFSAVFRAKKSGDGVISLGNAQFLKNDGKGSAASVKTVPFAFSVSDNISSEPNAEKIIDTEMPENFQPTISRDPNIFDGKYFLVFVTQDKGTGVDHYEIDEGSGYVSAESPYLLKNQLLDTKIFVKAVDKAGNARVVEISATHLAKRKLYLIIFGILVLSFIIFVRRKTLWKKHI